MSSGFDCTVIVLGKIKQELEVAFSWIKVGPISLDKFKLEVLDYLVF